MRASARKRGYDKAHEKWRVAVLSRDPICKLCRREPSTTADHIIPIRKGGARFDPANGQGLCHHCHSSAKQRIDNGNSPRFGCDIDGNPLGPNHPWTR